MDDPGFEQMTAYRKIICVEKSRTERRDRWDVTLVCGHQRKQYLSTTKPLVGEYEKCGKCSKEKRNERPD